MSTDRDALVDVLGAIDRLGLEALNDDGQGGETYRGAVAYAPPTLFALRDAVRRARLQLDDSPAPVAPVGADERYLAGWHAGVEYGQHLASIAARRREAAAYAAGRAREAGAQP